MGDLAYREDLHWGSMYLAQLVHWLSVPSTVIDPNSRRSKFRYGQQRLSVSRLVYPRTRLRSEVELEDIDHVWRERGSFHLADVWRASNL